MATTINLALCAGDVVWVIVDPDQPERSIRKGDIRMIETKSVTSTPDLIYHIRLDGEAGTTKITETTEPPENIFAEGDIALALARYQTLLTT